MNSLALENTTHDAPLKGLDGTVQIAIARLKPHDRQARTHSNRQIRKIATSIETFGFVNPVLIDGDNSVIAGHGRIEAAKQLGWDKVPTLRVDYLSEAEKRAYILADNRLAEEAGWDQEILAIELQCLIDMDFSVELTGFDLAEVDEIIEVQSKAANAASGIEDEVPPEPEDGQVVSRVGDLWELGSQETDNPATTLETSKTNSIVNHTKEPEPPLFKPLRCPILYDDGQIFR